MSTPDAIPHRRADVLAQDAGGQTVLLRPEDGGYYALRSVGARIWDLCDGTRALDDIARVLVTEFEAPLEQIRTDLADYVAELRRERLLAGPA